jgi:hypothetical protein
MIFNFLTSNVKINKIKASKKATNSTNPIARPLFDWHRGQPPTVFERILSFPRLDLLLVGILVQQKLQNGAEKV